MIMMHDREKLCGHFYLNSAVVLCIAALEDWCKFSHYK